MTVSVGQKSFEFKKPVMKHLKHLAEKKYEDWFKSEEMGEALTDDVKFQAYAEKWKAFCQDVFVQYGEELEFDRLTPAEVEYIAVNFFASLKGTLPEQEKPAPSSAVSGTQKQSK